MTNFDYFSMYYLNDWFHWDKPLMERIKSNDDEEAAHALVDAATYYKVIRNLKNIPQEKYRFYELQKKLKSVTEISNENASDAVLKLASDIEKIYGSNAISASSKLLWLKFRSPIIIYDSLALKWLKNRGHKIPKKNHYENYRRAWLFEYDVVKEVIQKSCSTLTKVKKHTFAYNISDVELNALTARSWFHERVFDKHLWFNGAKL